MIINIKRDKDGMEDWAIIELQGDLKFADTSADMSIGNLHFTKSGTPILIIGIHVLYGKEVALPKPIAVLEKTYESVETFKNEPNAHVKYIAKAIVKKKLIFKTRPKPIILNVPKCN